MIAGSLLIGAAGVSASGCESQALALAGGATDWMALALALAGSTAALSSPWSFTWSGWASGSPTCKGEQRQRERKRVSRGDD